MKDGKVFQKTFWIIVALLGVAVGLGLCTASDASAAGPWIEVEFQVHPPVGVAPLTVSFTARVQRNVSGPITYRLDCQSDGVWDYEYLGDYESWGMTDACVYNDPGAYYPTIQVECQGVIAATFAEVWVRSDNPGTIEGRIRDFMNLNPIVGAEISYQGRVMGLTDAQGEYSFSMHEGVHELKVYKHLYRTSRWTVEVLAGETVIYDFYPQAAHFEADIPDMDVELYQGQSVIRVITVTNVGAIPFIIALPADLPTWFRVNFEPANEMVWLAPGQAGTISITFTGEEWMNGLYAGNIDFFTNDPDTGLRVPYQFRVNPTADVGVEINAHPPVVQPGGVVMGHVTFGNYGDVVAESVMLQIRGDFNRGMGRVALGQSFVFTDPQLQSKAKVVDGWMRIPLGDLDPGVEREIEFSFDIPLDTLNGEALELETLIYTSSYENPEDKPNNSAETTVTVATPDLQMKINAPRIVSIGQAFFLNFSVINHGLRSAEEAGLCLQFSGLPWQVVRDGPAKEVGAKSGAAAGCAIYSRIGTLEPAEGAFLSLMIVAVEGGGEIGVEAYAYTFSNDPSQDNNYAETSIWVEGEAKEVSRIFLPWIPKNH